MSQHYGNFFIILLQHEYFLSFYFFVDVMFHSVTMATLLMVEHVTVSDTTCNLCRV